MPSPPEKQKVPPNTRPSLFPLLHSWLDLPFLDSLSLSTAYTKLILPMVAISTALLAISTLVPKLGPLTAPLNDAVVRHEKEVQRTQPTPIPVPSHKDHPFASVIGPVIDRNFPDPAIIHVNGVSYAFATNNRGYGGSIVHIQMATSTDNTTWTYLTQDALPNPAAWGTGKSVWAPDVIQLDDGSFVMYFADQVISRPDRHCVGVATSKTVTGPYAPASTPFTCHLAQGGAIDPDGFQDVDGTRYVTYKVDGNSKGHGGDCLNTVPPIAPTPLMLQQVASDGMTLIGEPIEILDRDALDGPLIEAPSLHRTSQGIYFLFFSSNCFTGPLYDSNYATASNITGPYTRSQVPLFITGDGPDLRGPGGLDIVKDGTRVVFHSHMNNSFGYVGYTPRAMYTANLTFSGHTVSAS